MELTPKQQARLDAVDLEAEKLDVEAARQLWRQVEFEYVAKQRATVAKWPGVQGGRWSAK